MSRNAPPDVGEKIKLLRKEKKLTLEQLSGKSGVSKSMLSQIERGRTNPTLAILWSLTRSLDIELADLLNRPDTKEKPAHKLDAVRAHQTPEIQSADGKCILRILGPIDLVAKTEWYDMTLEKSGILDSDGHGEGTMEHLTVLEGRLEVGNGARTLILETGDTARYDADIPHHIRNIGKDVARALLLVLSP